MMRYMTMEQKNLYERYAELSKAIIDNARLKSRPLNETMWDALSMEGTWALPIDIGLGGKGGSWQDVVVAMDGLFSHYFNADLLNVFIAQVSALYLFSEYGTALIKERYLPRLMHGEIIPVYHQYTNPRNKINHLSSFKISKTYVYMREIEKEIIFYIYEKSPHRSNDLRYQALKGASSTENIFTAKDVGVSAMYDLIDFERLFYAVVSASFASKVDETFRGVSHLTGN